MLKVSVIIPTLDEEENIGAAISSAKAAGAHEVIVSDGGSSDRTVEVASDIAIVHVAGTPGRGPQQNEGAMQATGDVLLFLHADCRLSPASISELNDRLSDSSEIVAGCFRQEIDRPGLSYRMVEAGNLWRAQILKWAYGDQAIFVRTHLFRKINGFPNLPLMEDLYLMKRLKSCGRIVVLNAQVVVSSRRWHNRGIWNQTVRNWCLLTAAHLGVSPDRLVKFYPSDR